MICKSVKVKKTIIVLSRINPGVYNRDLFWVKHPERVRLEIAANNAAADF